MKKIVYITDYSENSVAALKYAAKLGKLLEMDVIALHVYPPAEEEGRGVLKKDVRKKHQAKLLDFCQLHLKERYKTSEITVAAIKGGNVAQAVASFIRDMQVHLVVMGACGSKTLKEMFLSNIAQDLMDYSHFPVLAVPPDYKPQAIKNILFASVLDARDIEQLQSLVQIMAPAKPKIDILHVTHKTQAAAQAALDEFEQQVQKEIPYDNFRFRYIQSNEVFETLRAAVDESKPDLMLMPDCSNKNEVDRIIIRDKTKNLQSCTKVPLLSFPTVMA